MTDRRMTDKGMKYKGSALSSRLAFRVSWSVAVEACNLLLCPPLLCLLFPFLGEALADLSEHVDLTCFRLDGGLENKRLRLAPFGHGLLEEIDVRLQGGSAQLVRFGEHEHARHVLAHQPVEEFEINDLRRMPAIDEHEDETEIGPLREVVHDHALELVPIRGLRVTVAGQVHEAPLVVDQEEIDQLRAARRGRNLGEG